MTHLLEDTEPESDTAVGTGDAGTDQRDQSRARTNRTGVRAASVVERAATTTTAPGKQCVHTTPAANLRNYNSTNLLFFFWGVFLIQPT
jgi:hypothetical protein